MNASVEPHDITEQRRYPTIRSPPSSFPAAWAVNARRPKPGEPDDSRCAMVLFRAEGGFDSHARHVGRLASPIIDARHPRSAGRRLSVAAASAARTLLRARSTSIRRWSRPPLPATAGRPHETAHAQEKIQPLVTASRTVFHRDRCAAEEAGRQAATSHPRSRQKSRSTHHQAGRRRPCRQTDGHRARRTRAVGRAARHLAALVSFRRPERRPAREPSCVCAVSSRRACQDSRHASHRHAARLQADRRIVRRGHAHLPSGRASGVRRAVSRTGQDDPCAPLLALAWRCDRVRSRGRRIAGRCHRAAPRLRSRPDLRGRPVRRRRARRGAGAPVSRPFRGRRPALRPGHRAAVVDDGRDEPDASRAPRRSDRRARRVRRRRVLSRHAGPRHPRRARYGRDRPERDAARHRVRAAQPARRRTQCDPRRRATQLRAGRCGLRRLSEGGGGWSSGCASSAGCRMRGAAGTRASRSIPPRGRTRPRCSGISFVVSAASDRRDARRSQRPLANGRRHDVKPAAPALRRPRGRRHAEPATVSGRSCRAPARWSRRSRRDDARRCRARPTARAPCPARPASW